MEVDPKSKNVQNSSKLPNCVVLGVEMDGGLIHPKRFAVKFAVESAAKPRVLGVRFRNGLGVDAETKELSRDFSVALRNAMLALFLSVAVPWFSPSFAQDKQSGRPSVRACPDSWNDGVRSGKKSHPTGKKKVAPKQSGACIELAFSPLNIQEYLQSYARQKHWLITDDQLNEDSWTFSLDIDHDELMRDTLPDASQKGVEWKQAAVRVHINALLLPDGFARTIIYASFRGYGRNTDQFALQREYWDLESSTTFENSLASTLREHFSQLPAKETPSARPVP